MLTPTPGDTSTPIEDNYTYPVRLLYLSSTGTLMKTHSYTNDNQNMLEMVKNVRRMYKSGTLPGLPALMKPPYILIECPALQTQLKMVIRGR